MAAPHRDILSTAPGAASPSHSLPIEACEKLARDGARHGPAHLFLANGLSAPVFFGTFVLGPQAAFGAALTVGATLASYYASGGDSASPRWWYGGNMSWVLLSLAVVMPMMATVRVAFERRERALRAIEIVRSKSYQLYLAHARWDWGVDPPGDRGRDRCDEDWLAHADAALVELLRLGSELHRHLTLPGFTRARHRVTEAGRRESARTAHVSYRLYDSVSVARTTRLALLCEDLKRSGLALPEAIRIRKWERALCGAVEDLRLIKTYRTPQALRSFARIFAALLPPFYGPLFAQLSRDADSVALGVCFGLLASLALTALFEANTLLEDPFVAYLAVDGIDVYGELITLQEQELMGARRECFPNAPPLKYVSSGTVDRA